MLRKFKIAIDGSEYLVEMEEIGGVPQPAAAPTMAVTATLDPPAAEPIVETAPAGADAITAPMPGTILKILVAPGSSVKENQPLMILEAMKMEIPVVAPEDGTVASIDVAVGDAVEAGQTLATLN